MKLAYLKSKNFKSIEEIEIEFISPDGKEHSAVLKGKNESGKSSVIDAVLTTLKDLGTIQQPVKQGKDTATNTVHILIDKDQTINGIGLVAGTVLVCERKYTKEGKSTLKVSTLQGTDFKKPKELLDTILGLAVIRDPMELMSMKPKEQMNFVMEFLKIDTGPIDQQIDEANTVIYAKGIEKKSFEKAIPVTMPPVVPKPDIDADEIDGLTDQWDKFDKESTGIISKMNVLSAGINSTEASLKEIEAEIKRLQEKHNASAVSLTAKKEELADLKKKLPEPPKKSKEEIKAARTQITAYSEYVRQVASINDAKQLLRGITDDIGTAQETRTKLKREKEQMLSHNLPVKGLTFGEDGLLLNGLSITPDQLSESQAYLLWMDILFAFHPNLKLIWFKAAHSFDTERRAEVLKKIADNGFIGILEQVSDDEKIQVILIENKPKADENTNEVPQ